jgi:hypothetical protein
MSLTGKTTHEVPMKTLLSVLILLGASILAQAQVDDSFDLDLGPVVSEDIGEEGAQESKDPPSAVNSETKQNRSIYIVNQATSGSKAGAASKTEQNDTAILGSRAEDLKKNRHRAEMETELKATEKIEESRLDDERRRSEALFGERFKDLDRKNEPTAQPVYVPGPQPVVQPVVQPVIQQGLDREELREELKSVLSEKEVQKKKAGPTKSYFIAMAGLTEFPKADNIQGSGAFGIGLGVEAKEKILVEGMFQYASFQKSYPYPTDIEEYSGIGAIKFQFSSGTIRPLAGGLAVYSYRTYTDNFVAQSRQASSSVLDAGVLGGAQFELTDDFAIGAEFRYLWNITSKTGDAYPLLFPNEQPLDQFSHYVVGITGRFNF